MCRRVSSRGRNHHVFFVAGEMNEVKASSLQIFPEVKSFGLRGTRRLFPLFHDHLSCIFSARLRLQRVFYVLFKHQPLLSNSAIARKVILSADVNIVERCCAERTCRARHISPKSVNGDKAFIVYSRAMKRTPSETRLEAESPQRLSGIKNAGSLLEAAPKLLIASVKIVRTLKDLRTTFFGTPAGYRFPEYTSECTAKMLETCDSGATNLRISLATGKPLPQRGLTYSAWQPRHPRTEGESRKISLSSGLFPSRIRL